MTTIRRPQYCSRAWTPPPIFKFLEPPLSCVMLEKGVEHTNLQFTLHAERIITGPLLAYFSLNVYLH